jgi:alpha-1,2-glucosyltransferase
MMEVQTGIDAKDASIFNVREAAVLLASAVVFLGGLLFWFRGAPPIVDEYDHALQIVNFVTGKFELNPSLAMGPGYHAVMAAIARIFGSSDLDMLRLYTTVLGLICIFVFYLTSVSIGNGASFVRSMQFMALPVIFPYFSLVYSDVFALLGLMLCYYWQLKKRYVVAGLCAFIAVITRQPNILWVAMFSCMDFYARSGNRLTFPAVVEHLRKTWCYSLLMLLFVLFVIINRGVAIGQENYHVPTFQVVNVFFILLLFGFMFMPSLCANLKQLSRLLRLRKIWLALLAVLFLFYFKFNTFHEWNSTYINYTVIHNDILALMMWYPFWRFIFYIVISLSVLFLFFTKELSSSENFIYVTSFVYLSLIFLIEPRYYFPVLTLYCLHRSSQTARVEAIQTVYLIVMSVILAYLNRRYNCLL